MEPVSVSALSAHIVFLFQNDEYLRDVLVLGEVSNWNRAASGHAYFSLKDDGAAVNAVMWRRNAASHSWLPENGDQVVARGYVDVYPDRGVYQLYVSRIQPAGRGQLFARFEALKVKLQQEGLFDAERKRPIPRKVRRIGVVTSPDAAALRDVLRVLSSRWPLAEVVVFPTLVQGSEAPAQIVAALASAAQYDRHTKELDVILLVRGGGSMEDLWAFNDERVAYALAECPLPVIAGVGHETDFTIVDFVADLRAATPSAAAAAAVPDQAEVKPQLAAIVALLAAGLDDQVVRHRQDVELLQRRLERAHPPRMIDVRRQGLDERERRLDASITNRLMRLRMQSGGNSQRLAALNPRNVLKRGYSIVTKSDGAVVTRPDQIGQDELLGVTAYGGIYEVVAKRPI